MRRQTWQILEWSLVCIVLGLNYMQDVVVFVCFSVCVCAGC